MSCNYQQITAALSSCGGERATKGIEPRIFVAPHRTLVSDTIVNNTITDPLFCVFNPFIEITGYKNTFNAGSELIQSELIGNGYKHFISFTYNGHNAEVDTFDNVTVVVIRGGVLEIYGAKNGLWKKSQSVKANDNFGMQMVELETMEGQEEDYSCYLFNNGENNLALLTAYELITGLQIGADGKISIQVDTDKTVYCKTPNGAILTSTDGIIDTTWGGSLGSVVIAVEKSTTRFALNDDWDTGSIGSDFIGALNPNLSADVIASSCTSLTSLSAPLATEVYASYCTSLTSLSAPLATTVVANGSPALTSLSAPLATYIYASSCTSLTSLSAPLATTVYANSCPALSAQSIYDALDNAYTLALGSVTDGILDFGGTTVVPAFDGIPSPIHPIDYLLISGYLTNNYSWTVTIA